MWLPAIFTVIVVLYTRYKVPKPSILEENISIESEVLRENNVSSKHLPKSFWYYMNIRQTILLCSLL